MANSLSTIEQRIRAYMNPAIAGKFTDALIAAIAKGDADNLDLILSVKDQLFIATATGTYLDKIAAGIGITRPPGVGIDDNTFRDLVVSQTNNKLVTNIFLEILELFYGADAIKANTTTDVPQTYTLADGMTLEMTQDSDPRILTVIFNTADFANINQATAIEVANAISKQAFNNGFTISAAAVFDSVSGDTFIQLFSGTRGPKSAITVVGGQAQNYLRFPLERPTTQQAGTQFTPTIVGSNVRFTWTAGTDPSLQFVSVDDYANIYGAGFIGNNKGSYVIVNVVSGPVGQAYFEIQNGAFAVQAPVTLSSVTDLTFFKPVRNVIQQQPRYASIYEVNPYEIIAFLPATSKIVKRDLIGSAHLHGMTPDPTEPYPGPYLYDTKNGFSIQSVFTTIQTELDAGQVYTVINATNTHNFPDGEGFLVFDFGTTNQEGPVRYFSRPSSGSLQLDPSYKFQKTHAPGADVTLIFQRKPYQPSIDGIDYPFYVTGTINGRIQAQNLIQELSASGIFLRIIIVYPQGPGMNNIQEIYGPDIG